MGNSYISVPLKNERLGSFYESVKTVLDIDQEVTIDCRHIEVSMDRMYAIRNAYPASDDAGFNMLWVIYGPKVNHELCGEVVKIEEGFI